MRFQVSRLNRSAIVSYSVYLRLFSFRDNNNKKNIFKYYINKNINDYFRNINQFNRYSKFKQNLIKNIKKFLIIKQKK